MSNRDLPAQPIFDQTGEGLVGLTKLEYAAIQNMAALMSELGSYGDISYMAKDAIRAANALFDELEKKGGADGDR